MEKYMKTTIQKWGNSSGIRLPKLLLQELHLDNGTVVELERVGDGIMIFPRKPTREETLDLLLERISPENMYGPELFGDEAGGEV
jgi:antitoxin MazE